MKIRISGMKLSNCNSFIIWDLCAERRKATAMVRMHFNSNNSGIYVWIAFKSFRALEQKNCNKFDLCSRLPCLLSPDLLVWRIEECLVAQVTGAAQPPALLGQFCPEVKPQHINIEMLILSWSYYLALMAAGITVLVTGVSGSIAWTQLTTHPTIYKAELSEWALMMID